jgi:hypothetical protein
MAKPKAKKPPPPDEDEAQSRRFIQTVQDLEAAGELNLTEGEAALERMFARSVVPPHKGHRE